MTVKERTKPTQQAPRSSIGEWLMVGAIVAAVVLLAIRVVDLMGDEEGAPAVPATEVGTEWTLEDELTAIRNHARSGQAQIKSSASAWTLEDELAAIHGKGGGQPTQSSKAGEPITRQSGPR